MTTKLDPVRDPAQADVLDRIGVILTGLREIGRYMGVSGMTILRWHERYRGRTEAWLCFPLMMFPTGKGFGLIYKAHTGLIAEWMQRWSDIDSKERQSRAKRPRKTRKMLQMGVTDEGLGVGSTEGRTIGIRETSCPCGVPSRCLVHDDPFKGEAGPRIDEEPVKQLPPVNPEPAPAPQKRSGIQRIEGCVCSTGLTCEAHGEEL